jgi:hypothetical protein
MLEDLNNIKAMISEFCITYNCTLETKIENIFCADKNISNIIVKAEIKL